MPAISVAGGVAKSEQGATAGEIEVGGASSDGDRPRTVATYQKLPRTVLKPEI